MPSYARAAGAKALGGGIRDIMQMLMANKADDVDRELQELREREAQRMGSAAELVQPDVVTLTEAAGRDPGLLSSISNAAAPLQFTPPPLKSVDVPGGEPLTAQQPGKSMTPFGNVRDPGLARALAGVEAQELTNARTAERSRLIQLAEDFGYSPAGAAAAVDGIPIPPEPSGIDAKEERAAGEYQRTTLENNRGDAARWAAGILSGSIRTEPQGDMGAFREVPDDDALVSTMQQNFRLGMNDARLALSEARNLLQEQEYEAAGERRDQQNADRRQAGGDLSLSPALKAELGVIGAGSPATQPTPSAAGEWLGGGGGQGAKAQLEAAVRAAGRSPEETARALERIAEMSEQDAAARISR